MRALPNRSHLPERTKTGGPNYLIGPDCAGHAVAGFALSLVSHDQRYTGRAPFLVAELLSMKHNLVRGHM